MSSVSASSDAKDMGLIDHLRELRVRIFVSLGAIIALTVLAYCYSDDLFQILCAPYYANFPHSILIGTGPAEALVLKVKVALCAGFVLATPIMAWQAWLFITPGLYKSERRLLIPFVASASFLFMLGVWFCYTLIFPIAFSFFREQYASINITPTVRLSEHLSTTLTILISFGVVFELPVVAFILARLGVLTSAFLIRSFRPAVLIIFIISAILTPPDMITQFLMAGPLILLYGLSIPIVKLAERPQVNDPSEANDT